MSIEEKYSINPVNPLSSLIVRDAMVTCFFEAHCMDAGMDINDKEEGVNKEYCKSIIKKAFEDIGADFDKPDKESLEKVVLKLKEFSINFRDQKMVEQHANEIQYLIDKL